MKQYFLTKAYTGNTHVVCCSDGKIENDEIISDYELGYHLSRIESKGYTQGYYLPEHIRIMQQKYNEYLEACSRFKEATQASIELSDDDAKRYFPLCNYNKEGK